MTRDIKQRITSESLSRPPSHQRDLPDLLSNRAQQVSQKSPAVISPFSAKPRNKSRSRLEKKKTKPGIRAGKRDLP